MFCINLKIDLLEINFITIIANNYIIFMGNYKIFFCECKTNVFYFKEIFFNIHEFVINLIINIIFVVLRIKVLKITESLLLKLIETMLV